MLNNTNTDALVLTVLSKVVADKPIQNMLATEAFLKATNPLIQKAAYNNMMNARKK